MLLPSCTVWTLERSGSRGIPASPAQVLLNPFLSLSDPLLSVLHNKMKLKVAKWFL